MSENNVSLRKIRKLDERVFPELLKNKSFLTCINKKNGVEKKISINALYDNDREFWLKDDSSWTYYVNDLQLTSILQKINNFDMELEKRLVVEDKKRKVCEQFIEKDLNNVYESLVCKNRKDRIDGLSQALKRIKSVIHSRDISSEERRNILLEVSTYSYMVNKITLNEVVKMTDNEARKASFEVAKLTERIISSLTSVLDENSKDISFFYSLMGKSNGVTLRHMVRTFILSYRFLHFFNSEITHKGLASKTRVNFNQKYRKWYSSLIPQFPEQNLTLENVFKGGMRPVPDSDILVYSAGFLLHDIGKQQDIDYYEGPDEFDGRKVESHAKAGYRMLMQKTVYSEKIAAIAGFHHEYYGHESGYGYYRELCALMKLDDHNYRLDSCMSYELEDLHKFKSLAYLPVKILEIVDVFDAITDPGRSYKSHLETFQALRFMKEEFVIKNKKVDLILFELFVRFLNESGFAN